MALDRGEGALDRFDRGEGERGTLISQVSPTIVRLARILLGSFSLRAGGGLFVPERYANLGIPHAIVRLACVLLGSC